MASDEELDNVVEQWAASVVDFSSQYGSENSISYTVQNLSGPSTVFPVYGDFTQACVLRTYGPWWKAAPSAATSFGRTPDSFCSLDYIELQFDEKVYPTRIDVYETYNPGAIVRILACDTNPSDAPPEQGHVKQGLKTLINMFSSCCSKPSTVESNTSTVESDAVCNPPQSKVSQSQWAVLWSGPPEAAPPQESRVFSPDLNTIYFPTNILRLELNHDYCDYYTELDAVKLCGRLLPPPGVISGAIKQFQEILSIQNSEKTVQGVEPGDVTARNNHLLDSGAENLKRSTDIVVKELASLHLQDGLSAALDASDNGDFDLLPGEVIQLIVHHLDLPSLCSLSQACHLFYKHCYDPLQYIDVNLQPHWTKVTDASLDSFHSRCRHLQRLDMSWCGSHCHISGQTFDSFLKQCGKELTCLRLACCKFVNNTAVSSITTHCPQLQELDLQSNQLIDNIGFLQLTRLTRLTRLNLYRTVIDIHSLVAVVRSCPDLLHLNVGSCTAINSYDDLAIELSKHCRNLRSLDAWRSRTLSEIGLHSLSSSCSLLEDLDVGWCSGLKSETGCLQDLANRCHHLKKLFLTANRTVCDEDLDALAQHCPHLEQLDILGTRVSARAVQRFMERCKKLKFFDVSFCTSFDGATVKEWAAQYPHICFKRSFQT